MKSRLFEALTQNDNKDERPKNVPVELLKEAGFSDELIAKYDFVEETKYDHFKPRFDWDDEWDCDWDGTGCRKMYAFDFERKGMDYACFGFTLYTKDHKEFTDVSAYFEGPVGTESVRRTYYSPGTYWEPEEDDWEPNGDGKLNSDVSFEVEAGNGDYSDNYEEAFGNDLDEICHIYSSYLEREAEASVKSN